MKIALAAALAALLVACIPCKTCPTLPPPPPPPPAQPFPLCVWTTMPPLVASWLAKVPLPAPNDDEAALLVSWAEGNCSAQSQPN